MKQNCSICDNIIMCVISNPGNPNTWLPYMLNEHKVGEIISNADCADRQTTQYSADYHLVLTIVQCITILVSLVLVMLQHKYKFGPQQNNILSVDQPTNHHFAKH